MALSTGIVVEGKRVRAVTVEKKRGEFSLKDVTVTSLSDFSPEGTTITAISGRGTTFRILRFPFTQRRRILQVLDSELEDTIPFSLKEVTYDFQMWEKGRGSTILVAIVKNEEIESFSDTLRENSLSVSRIGIESLYLSTLFQFVGEEEDVAILDIEHDHSNFTGWAGGKKFYPRYLSVGGDLLTEMIMKRESVEREDAEKIKRGDSLAEGLVEDYLKLLSVELLQTIYSFRNQTGREIKKIYLTGGGIRPENLVKILGKVTGIKCEVLSVNLAGYFPPEPPESSFHLPLALALNGFRGPFTNEINFALPAEQGEKEWAELRPRLLTTGILYTLVLIFIIISTAISYSRVKREYVETKKMELEAIHRALPGETVFYDYVDTLQSRIDELKKRLQSGGGKKKMAVIDVLKSISSSMPSDVNITVTDLTIEGSNMRLRGETSDFSMLEKIRSSLSNSGVLESVAIVDSRKLQKSGRVDFTITAKLKGE